jgi:hypothetical protein
VWNPNSTRKALEAAREESDPRGVRGFVARLAKQLHAETDSEDRTAPSGSAADGLIQAQILESPRGRAESANTGKYHVSRALDGLRFPDDRRNRAQ